MPWARRGRCRAALEPALREAGLPAGAVVLIERAERAAGWALFADPGLALAVARGSGQAVAQLGAVARQAGVPVSLHGTGGAWIVADDTAGEDALDKAVYHSLDSQEVQHPQHPLRHVRGGVPPDPGGPGGAAPAGGAPGARLQAARHGRRPALRPAGALLRPRRRAARRGEVIEPLAEPAAEADLGTEWEWEGTPEVTLHVAPDADGAVALFNRYSPHFVASLLSADATAHERFFRAIDAPFVGNGFTRWVDGQFALRRPELGLSSWQFGRLFARSGILTGDGVFSVRLRAVQDDPDVHT